MTNRLLHTPEGVRDIYSAECRRKLALEDKMLEVLYLYGYEHIETPSFEYFDIFNKDRGSVGDREMLQISVPVCGQILHGREQSLKAVLFRAHF